MSRQVPRCHVNNILIKWETWLVKKYYLCIIRHSAHVQHSLRSRQDIVDVKKYPPRRVRALKNGAVECGIVSFRGIVLTSRDIDLTSCHTVNACLAEIKYR